jgi:hypothetical protein
MTLSNSVKYFPLIETDLIFDSSNSSSSVLPQETQPQNYSLPVLKYKVPDSSASIVTGRTVMRSNPGGGDMIRIRPDGSWGQLSLPYNGYRVFPGGKRPGRGVDHLPQSSAAVKERGLYLCSPSGPSWPVQG